MLYLDKEAVVGFNRKIAMQYGQAHVLIAEANLVHFLEQAKRYGEKIGNDEERLIKKAAYLLYHLAYDAHAFSDGNKRTALMATQTFLELNSYEMHEEQETLASTMKEIAEGKISLNAICRWLTEKTKKK
ncbi:MAG: type II toxin-antitoxin system death-on-curing family toxin [Candidatus Micrarchaeia archaeon]|jgi:death-on-curing protein